MSNKMPIGISDFKKLIEGNYYYVDKTLLIKDLLDNKSEITLITRPRRFGKTINMSMLKYYFDNKETNNNLFSSLAISQYPEYKNYQGKYPVIYISLKDVKSNTWEQVYRKLQNIIQFEISKCEFLMDSEKLNSYDKTYLDKLLNFTADRADFEDSLSRLIYYLYKYYGVKPILLIDEYDEPIQSGFINNYYEDIISFIRNWLSGALKDNSYLEFAILTGILRVAKESIFSGLNNLEVLTIIDEPYKEYFGFTEEEVKLIAKVFKSEDKLSEIKDWYDGYNFSGLEIYNPWSVLNYFKQHCVPQAYWVNTSGNDIIKSLIKLSDSSMKETLKSLLNGSTIKSSINTAIIYSDIYESKENLYSFLLFTGYLKTISKEKIGTRNFYTLAIPNKEIGEVYADEILKQFKTVIKSDTLNNLLIALLSRDVVAFKTLFQEIILNAISCYDTSESFYHGLILGIVALLIDTHEVKSNRESGYGRFDVMLIPRNNNLQGIILEFKYTDNENELKVKAIEALQQISDKKYETELLDRGIKEIYKYGIAFHKKRIEMLSEY